ncbi:DNA replication and repair protein RecF [Nitrosococcus oceani ATCC 19707]|uniref:DNA replication and repair protein RecF n=2 Tax=Nitrosococcus oceani TaxID=1229 RepID=RECF_NITOC|nr:DNA replication/repair protein RecF [Nitrosococcus oceani]Q3JF36.1 RecName: Full=DNA replication and repair protein RecF [Nitrosococcus oceani ATCC 19707]ABA56560.1 DNA replication and repair protein RecF [Nitrosococcus oceani ATCC 19707]GEM21608.1 DNA replication and repair protein RecF [Nitrosococcus oceani]
MMHITHLDIRNFRNLKHIELHPSKGVNILSGANSSGKTSFLEAIYLLGLGRSFRTVQLISAIQAGMESLRVVAKVKQVGGSHTAGVEFGPAGFRARINKDTVKKRSQLATQLPLLYMSSYSHVVLDGGPRYRRQWLDWSLFHLEPGFHDLWWCYQRTLKQRNHVLRVHKPSWQQEINAWNKKLSTYGEQITSLREAILFKLQDSVSQLFTALAHQPISPVTMEFKQGWARTVRLEEILNESLNYDRAAGYTRYGPHRAEVAFYVDGKDVREILSRGQQKVFCYSLALSQANLLYRTKEQNCIFLIDDFTSELDADHRKRLLTLLNKLGMQVFATTIESLGSEIKAHPNIKEFHVKLGQVEEMV